MVEAVTVTTPSPATFGNIAWLAMLAACLLVALAACGKGPLS